MEMIEQGVLACVSFVILLLVSLIIYVLASLFSYKGKHGPYAKKPFTGGILQEPIGKRYYTDMLIFVSIFLLLESYAIFILFVNPIPINIFTLLLGLLGIIIPPIIVYEMRRGR